MIGSTEKRNEIERIVKNYGFVEPQLYRSEIINNRNQYDFNLIVELDAGNRRSVAVYASALAAALMEYFNFECQVNSYVKSTLKSLYKASILSKTVNLNDLKKINELFGVESINQIIINPIDQQENDIDKINHLLERKEDVLADIRRGDCSSSFSGNFFDWLITRYEK